MQYRYIGGAFLLLTIASLFSLFFFKKDVPLPPSEFAPYAEQVAYWQRRVDDVGGLAAYDELATRVESLSFNTKHQLAHAFGAALFKEKGVAGITVCDDQYSFGCYHQFLGDAILSLGLVSIQDLNEKCFDADSARPISCTHGVGHGALATLGYDDESLKKALHICKDLPNAQPIGGCYGGVFMEYNVQTMLAEDGVVRESKGNPFSPCDALEAEFVPACLYWIPQWWLLAVENSKSVVEAYKNLGNLCRKFSKNSELLRICFEGLGNVVEAEAEFKPDVARDMCDAAGSNPEERLYCRAIGANHFGIDVGSDAAHSMCDDLTGRFFEYCDAFAKNKTDTISIQF